MALDTLSALATLVGKALSAKRQTLATAESCTGGWVAEVVTSIAGSSDWFERGFVTYSNAAKGEMLGVAGAKEPGFVAVSESTARAMAAGALTHSHATVALAVTGIAGPGGGSADKPVGTVCFAWAERGGKVTSQTRHFEGDREAVRRQSVIHALMGLYMLLGGESLPPDFPADLF